MKLMPKAANRDNLSFSLAWAGAQGGIFASVGFNAYCWALRPLIEGVRLPPFGVLEKVQARPGLSLLRKSGESLDAARLMEQQCYHDFAASRAY